MSSMYMELSHTNAKFWRYIYNGCLWLKLGNDFSELLISVFIQLPFGKKITLIHYLLCCVLLCFCRNLIIILVYALTYLFVPFLLSLSRPRGSQQSCIRGSIRLVLCTLIWSRRRWNFKSGVQKAFLQKLKHKPSMDGDPGTISYSQKRFWDQFFFIFCIVKLYSEEVR